MQLEVVDRSPSRDWVLKAIALLEDETVGSPETRLHRLDLGRADLDVFLKDESAHATGSLKHRLARSLVLYGLCNGWIVEGTTLVEASSGSTAVSEAWFARLLGLPFIAVLPRGTSAEKVDLITELGGRVAFVDSAGEVYAEAARLAQETGGHYLDQFTYAERATDWRGNNNIAESLLAELSYERHTVPSWVVVGAGTGGTASTIGRYLRYRRLDTRLCLVDPEGSAFMGAWADRDPSTTACGSRIEGIGRPRLEPSFMPELIDRAVRVPDAASIAAMQWLRDTTGLNPGPSTGTNLIGVLLLAPEVRNGSIASLLCDGGDRYAKTYGDPDWVTAQGWDTAPWHDWIQARLA